ncbi:hypothetical protein ACSBOB_21675 [Mesorhizobium sp. ASY16-5R]|uniref:hypothetical protein n=1 Tax=Mesorhizobium sp. ASY16-5R TaxID=3445772 RepID=UPI003F9ED40C
MHVTRVGLSSCVLLVVGLSAADAADRRAALFEDPLFRSCINWMLDGSGGAMIENRCIADFAIPPPSIFSCARKVMTGFQSAADQEGCALIFEEQAKRVRSGYVK